MKKKARMLTRRDLLKAGSFAFFAVPHPMPFSRADQPKPLNGDRRRTVLVVLYLRGAMDGLMAVSPIADPHLMRLRPNLVMEGGDGLIDLDGRFGGHIAMAPLLPFFRDGRLAIVHGVGLPFATRSHFDAQEILETALPETNGAAPRWLHRASELLRRDGSPHRIESFTNLFHRSPDDVSGLVGNRHPDFPGLLPCVASGYPEPIRSSRPAAPAFARGRENQITSRSHRRQNARDAQYPVSSLGDAMRGIVRAIRDDEGLRIALVESGGWDTHVRQGTVNGSFHRRMSDLSRSIAAFWSDLRDRRGDVVLLAMTEFGRTVHENSSGGTDHGRASCMFVLGDAVNGGRIHGDFPSLRRNDLEEGRDLPVTTDFRSVLAAVSDRHLGLRDHAVLFPGWTGRGLPLFNDPPTT